MLHSVSITNFQSHQKTILEFSKGINIIIGQSDSGKSAILRALNWVINNRPSGETFRSNWGGDTEVVLSLEDKSEVLRYKTKKVPNGYQLHYSTEIKKKTGNVANTFKSFGQDVPTEIKEIINFSSLNMSGQFDSPFLLDVSGGEVARYLNKIVNLEQIDSALSSIGKTLREEQNLHFNKKTQLTEAEEKVKEFDWVEGVEGELEALELFERSLKQKEKVAISLASQINYIWEINEQLAELPDLSQYEKEVQKLIDEQGALEMKKTRSHVLGLHIENIEVKEGQIRTMEKNLGSWEQQFEAIMPEHCPLCGGYVHDGRAE